MSKLTMPSFIRYILVACTPMLFSMIAFNWVALDIRIMLFVTLAAYFIIFAKLIYITNDKVKSKKLIHIIIWSLVVVVTFPFGCLLFTIINRKKFLK